MTKSKITCPDIGMTVENVIFRIYFMFHVHTAQSPFGYLYDFLPILYPLTVLNDLLLLQ